VHDGRKFVRLTVHLHREIVSRSAEMKRVQERCKVMDNDQLEHIGL
jgi:hypothetical protein